MPTTCPPAPRNPGIPQIPLIAYKRISLELAGVVAAGIILAVIVCMAVGAVHLLPLATLSGVLCLSVVLLSLVITWRRSRLGLVPMIRGFMLSQFVRLFLGIVVAIILVLGCGFDVRWAAGWVLGWYWLLLAVEVWQLQRSVNRSIAAERGDAEPRAPLGSRENHTS